MGFDLRSKSENSEFHFTVAGWTFYLNLAQKYGWTPAGTIKPVNYKSSEYWDGRYDTNESQMVIAEDSKRLAAALDTALKSDNLEAVSKSIASDIEYAVIKSLGELPEGGEIDPDFDHVYIREFIAFCKKGAFFIE